MAPPHTTTWSATDREPLVGPAVGPRPPRLGADDAVAGAPEPRDAAAGQDDVAPAATARGISVRAIVCFTARPPSP